MSLKKFAIGEKERLKNQLKKTLHSTRKPEELLERIVLASTKPGDFVLDPFLEQELPVLFAKNLEENL